MGSVKFQLQQVAGLGVMSQPQGHTQDHTSCKLQHKTQHIVSSVHLILFSTLHFIVLITLHIVPHFGNKPVHFLATN